MMEAAPPAPFEVPKPAFLLELVIIALDTPAQLGEVDEFAEADIGWQRRQPILGRLGFAHAPLDEQPILRQRFRHERAMATPNAHAGEARRQPLGRTFPPPDRVPSMFGQITRQTFGRDQIGLVATPRIVQRPASALWSFAGWPYQDFRLNADDIAHPQRRHAGTQPRVTAIGGVHQCDVAWKAGLARPPYLLERDLRFGLEDDVPRHACLVPARPILDPVLRQIQPIGYRQTGVVVCDRQRHRYLTIGLLAELPAILMLHAYRMLSLFGETRVIDDPRLDRPLPFHCRQHHLAYLGQRLLV